MKADVIAERISVLVSEFGDSLSSDIEAMVEEALAEKVRGFYAPAGRVVPGHFHWVIRSGPGTESTWDAVEVMLPYFDEHGAVTGWEACGVEAFLPPERIKVIGPIPFPEMP